MRVLRDEPLEPGEGEPSSSQSCEETLQTEDHHGLMLDELAAFAKTSKDGQTASKGPDGYPAPAWRWKTVLWHGYISQFSGC